MNSQVADEQMVRFLYYGQPFRIVLKLQNTHQILFLATAALDPRVHSDSQRATWGRSLTPLRQQQQRQEAALGDSGLVVAAENLCVEGTCNGRKTASVKILSWRTRAQSYLSRARNFVALGIGMPANVTRSTIGTCTSFERTD